MNHSVYVLLTWTKADGYNILIVIYRKERKKNKRKSHSCIKLIFTEHDIYKMRAINYYTEKLLE